MSKINDPLGSAEKAILVGLIVGVPLTIFLACWAIAVWRKQSDDPEPPD
jgi:hypothetical protein